MKNGFLFLIVFVALACGGPPKGFLNIDEMKVALFHQAMAEEYLSSFVQRDTSFNLDSSRNAIFSQILVLNKIDSADFYRSLDYYKSDVKLFQTLIDSTNAYGIRFRDELNSQQEVKRERLNAIADSTALDSNKAESIKPDSSRQDSTIPDSALMNRKRVLPVN